MLERLIVIGAKAQRHGVANHLDWVGKFTQIKRQLLLQIECKDHLKARFCAMGFKIIQQIFDQLDLRMTYD